MNVFQTPSQQITEQLSKYLDFDQDQIQLGLWQGNLQINNVNLREDALSSILNRWKENPNHHEQQQQNKEPTVSYFFNRDLLLSDNPNPLRHLNIKLLHGSIESIQAIVPWKSILLSSKRSKDTAVKIKIKGLHIRLGFESCVSQALDKDGLRDVVMNNHHTKESNDDMDGCDSETNQNLSHPKYRAWKQNEIKNAEENLKLKQNIQYSTFEYQDQKSEKDNKQSHENEENVDTVGNNISSSFIERFVGSFKSNLTSNLGWRVVKSLQVELEDLQIVLVQDDVEIGFINKSIEIFEIDCDSGSAEYDSSHVNEERKDEGEESIGEADREAKRYRDSNGSSQDSAYVPSNHDSDNSQAVPCADVDNRQIIQKSIKVRGCGLFVRNVNPSSKPTNDEPILDEYFVLPTDIGANLTIRRDEGLSSAKIKVEKEDETMKSNPRNDGTVEKMKQRNDNNHNDNNGLILHNTSGPKRRRGKRDKRKYDHISSEVKNASVHDNFTSPSVKSDYFPGAVQTNESITYNPSIIDESFKDNIHSCVDQTVPQFSAQIAIDNMVMVLSTHNCAIIKTFMSDITKLVIGRPTEPILKRNLKLVTAIVVKTTADDLSIKANTMITRKWWIYIMFNVLRDLRKKRYLKRLMKPLNKSFSWSRHQRMKREYIHLYRRTRLQNNLYKDETSPFDFTFGLGDKEKLLALEDSLNVEQILLFRSLANSIQQSDIVISEYLSSSFYSPFNSSFSTNPSLSITKSFVYENIPKPIQSIRNDQSEVKQSRHRHQSLFSMENSTASVAEHKRAKTYTYDNLDVGKPTHRETLSLSHDLSTDCLKPRHQQKSILDTNIKDDNTISIGEVHRASSQGSISSVVTVSVKSIQLFVCKKVDIHEQTHTSFDFNNNDGVSTSTSTNFSNIIDNIESTKISIFGNPHEVIFSSIIHETKVHYEKNLEKKVKVVGIEGICCCLNDSFSLSSGTLQVLKQSQECSGQAFTIYTLDYLRHYPFYRKDEKKDNFLSAELVTTYDHGESLSLHMLISKIYSSATIRSSTSIHDFIHIVDNFDVKNFSTFPLSVYDRYRQNILKWQKSLQNSNSTEFNNQSNLYIEFRGYDLNFNITGIVNENFDHNISSGFGSVVLLQGSMIALRNSHASIEGNSMNCYLQSFPNSNYRNLLFIVKNIYMKNDTFHILEDVKCVELLFSTLKQVPNSNMIFKVSPNEISVNISPVTLLISKSRLIIIERVLKFFNDTVTDWKTVRGDMHDKTFDGPRILEYSGLLRRKTRFSFSSIALLFCEEHTRNTSAHGNDWKCVLRDILDCYLHQLVTLLKRNEVIPCSASDAACEIVLNRIKGLGFSDDEAQLIVDISYAELKNIKISREANSISFDDAVIRSRLPNDLPSGKELDVLVKITLEDVMNVLTNDYLLFPTKQHNTGCLSLTCGACSLFFDQLIYDWRASFSFLSINFKGRNGLSLLRIVPKIKNLDSEDGLDLEKENTTNDRADTAVCANLTMKALKYEFGEGGSSLSICADDRLMEASSKVETKEMLSSFSIGMLNVLFIEDEILRVITFLEDLCDSVKYVVCGNIDHSSDDNCNRNLHPFVTKTISGNMSSCDIVCCKNNFQPFTKLSLRHISLDVSSSVVQFDEGKSYLFDVGCRSVDVFDLTVFGTTYYQVISEKKKTLSNKEGLNDSFHLKLAISSDRTVSPTELLVVFVESKVFFLRRYLYELLQFLFSKDYGVGRIMYRCMGDSNEKDVKRMMYQFQFIDSSIIIPTSSDSETFVAFNSSKLVISNSYEKESWSSPTVKEDSETFENSPSDVTDSISSDIDLVSRISIKVLDADAFSGISKTTLIQDDACRVLIGTLRNIIRIGDVIDGNFIFEKMEKCNKIHLASVSEELMERQWAKINKTPICLEVLIDSLPSNMRVLLRNCTPQAGLSSSLSLDLHMSQFYAMLSTWYENMKELPVLFPYSSDYIQSQVAESECPSNWPPYGSAAYVERMITTDKVTFEIAISLHELEWCCRFDDVNYYKKTMYSSFMMDASTDSITLNAQNFMLKVELDSDGVMKTGLGATSFSVLDQRESRTVFPHAFDILHDESCSIGAAIDLAWGLQCGSSISSEDLNLPFQLSVFMTPDRWCLINLAMEDLETCTADLAFVWILLDYFGCYFMYEEYGNPYFMFQEKSDNFLDTFELKTGNDQISLNIDFRLWLLRPRIAILCDPIDLSSSAFVIKSADQGLFYAYKKIGNDFISQEVRCRNLDMMRLESCNALTPNIREVLSSYKWVNMLLRSLNMELIYDLNTTNNHYDLQIHVAQPNDGKRASEGIEFPPITASPLAIPFPKICKPNITPSHLLGPINLEIEFMNPDHFQMAFDTILKFAGPYAEEELCKESKSVDEEEVETFSNINWSFSVFLNVCGMKVFISDPLLGVHLPVVVVNVPDLIIHCSQLFCFKDLWTSISDFSDLQTCVDAHFWLDYYKSGPTHSWEPLVEPYKCLVLLEKSSIRGNGLTVSSECPFHFNLTGAFFETLAFAARSFAPYILNLLGIQKIADTEKAKKRGIGNIDFQKNSVVHECFNHFGSQKEVKHELVQNIDSYEPAAFSLINLTGEKIRFHQQKLKDSGMYIQYLQHKGIAALSFPATRSLVVNLQIVEVPVYKNGEQIINEAASGHFDSSNYIDIQIPGFTWSKSISVDITGKRFIALQSKSPFILDKMFRDWRLANALSLLTDVSFYDGGRQVTISSCFEIMNKTSHVIEMASHPNPLHLSKRKNSNKSFETDIDDCQTDVINPGETIQIPYLLLESSLQRDGESLGSFWLRPYERDNDLIEYLAIPGLKANDASIGFCSSPIQLVKLINESASMFAENEGKIAGSDAFSSGYQLSSPILENKKELILPFCYCVEVRRSPLVAPFPGHNIPSFGDDTVDEYDVKNLNASTSDNLYTEDESESFSNKSKISKKAPNIRETKKSKISSSTVDAIHGPVAYSLEIHPPIVIENLLPEKARYELMHATRQQVIWWSDLMPGESVPVHSVGLDAPLLLLIHLGYCRTPVGEGALVHHGSVSRNTNFTYEETVGNGLNTDKVINAMTKLKFSREDRLGVRLAHFNGNQAPGRKTVNNKRVIDEKVLPGSNENKDQQFHQTFSVHDIATETTVVDHLGQRLNLFIENKLGGGGQRHITVFCPYWIVNTTEHAFRYRQENIPSFVSGTMTNQSTDGSRFVDLVDLRNGKVGMNADIDTIFPGKQGALARPNLSVSEFSRLMEKDIPLDLMASMAFMFNFRGYERKLSIQLFDPTGGTKYCSQWSYGVSLESVGVSQTISMHCLDGRQLEIALTSRVAPGKLAAYTKIVRLSPKYVLVNQLARPIRLWQDSSLMHPTRTVDGLKTGNNREPPKWTEKSKENHSKDDTRKYDFLFGDTALLDYRSGTKMRPGTAADKSALYIITAGKGEMIPFHLPDTKFDRELRIDFGRRFNLTASFHADIISDHIFKISPVVDLRLLKHVDNRASSRFTVQLPPQDESEENFGEWDGELGLWFETIEWSHGTKIVVKGTKRGKYSINNTDIHVGDELVEVDGIPVTQLTFASTMKLIKERLAEVLEVYKCNQFQSFQNLKPSTSRSKRPKLSFKRFAGSNQSTVSKEKETLTLVFQTLEHRMKKLRSKALVPQSHSKMKSNTLVPRGRTTSGTYNELPTIHGGNSSRGLSVGNKQVDDTDNILNSDDDKIQVSLKHLNQSIFIFVHKVNATAPYRIENRSLGYIIYFRQKDCDHHQWNSLSSGESLDYTWEEPTKPYKLTVRVAYQNSNVKDNIGVVKNIFSLNFIANEEQYGFGPAKTIQLDEIGKYTEFSPHLYGHIFAEGKTKKLVISDHKNSSRSEELRLLEAHLNYLETQIVKETEKQGELRGLKYQYDYVNQSISNGMKNIKTDNNSMITSALPTVEENYETNNKPLEKDEFDIIDQTTYLSTLEEAINKAADKTDDEAITARHQILVEIVEASGLKHPHSDSNKTCSPYCTIRVIRRSQKHRPNIFSKSDTNSVKRTYYIEKSDSPKWSGMKFVFNVSPEAELDPQGYSIIVKLKDFRLVGKNSSLGMTEIRLHNLKHQKEVFGWYPLMSRTGRGSDIFASSAGNGRGSIKLRVQWIYSLPSLLNYYVILSENLLKDLNTKCEGIRKQLQNVQENQEEDIYTGDILSQSTVTSTYARKSLHTARNISRRQPRKKIRDNDNTDEEAAVNVEPELLSCSLDTKSIHQDHSSVITETKNDGYLLDNPRQFLIEGGQHDLLPYSINSMRSWLQASMLLNHSIIKHLYQHGIKDIVNRNREQERVLPNDDVKDEVNFKFLQILPKLAPPIMKTRKDDYFHVLFSSRESFEKAAQRSVRAVSNPGGWLKIRPITALYLPANGYTGMYVKIRYGSESAVSQTVPTPVNPEWTQYDDGDQEDTIHFTHDVRDNDFEVNVQALKTIGSLRLSVVGVKANSKEELGVLHLPLADAICCCTEIFDDEKNSNNSYVRWYQLTDPKWTESGDVDFRQSQRNFLTEQKDSNGFTQNYTKCIKLAMWWEKDENNTYHISGLDSDKLSHNHSKSYHNISLNGISAAVIDSFRARELLSIAFTDIDVRVLATKFKSWLGFVMGSIQIDHHDEKALEPIVLSPTPVMHPQPTIQFLAERDNLKSKSNIDSYKHVAIQLEELDVRIEESWLFDLWEMYSRLQKRYQVMQKSITRRTWNKSLEFDDNIDFNKGFASQSETWDESKEILDAILDITRDKDDLEAEAKTLKKIYIDVLMLGSIKLNISYVKSLREKLGNPSDKDTNGSNTKKTVSSNRRAETFRQWSEFGHDEDWGMNSNGTSRNLPMLISAVFPAISDAPVRVNGKVLSNVFVTWTELFATLKNYYVKEIMFQFYKIIGSLDIVGNPTEAINSLLKGARDFVVIPLREFLRSPQDPSRLGIGVAKGSLSLFSHFFSGVFGFVSNVSEAVGSGVATLSLDKYFKRWHAQQVADHIRHRNGHFQDKKFSIVASAVTQPFQDILIGVLFGASGLIFEPFYGARTKGAKGFAKGVGIGTIGLVTKPIVGLFDAFAHVADSINDAAKSINFFDKKFKPVQMRRFPYTFGCNNILLPFNRVHARTFSLLHLFPIDDDFGKPNKDNENEVLIDSELLLLYPGEATFVTVTTKRIVLFEVQTNGRVPPKRVWQIDFDNDVKITSNLENFRHSGFVLQIHRHHVDNQRDTSNNLYQTEVYNHNEVEIIDHLSPNKTKDFRILKLINERKVKKIYEQAGALLPHSAFTAKNDNNRNPVYAEVLGEFVHSKELTRIHNAICCLTRQFDSIIRWNMDVNEHEGCTSFGINHFVEEDFSIRADEENTDLYSHLEEVPWVHFSYMSNSNENDITAIRRKWHFPNELKVSERKGGPKWAIESRARSSFVPMPFPSLPASLSFDIIPELKKLKEKLELGEISLEDTEISIEKIVATLETEKGLYSSTNDFQPIKTQRTKQFFSAYEEAMNQNTNSLYIIDSDNDSDPGGNNNYLPEQRLAKVEHMLETLMSQIQSSSIRSSQPRPNHDVLSCTSMVSALSLSDYIADESTFQTKEMKENQELRKEIAALKLQLASAQTRQEATLASLGDTNTTNSRYKKKRKRNFIKKPWK